MNNKPAHHASALLRSRHAAARVSNEELFFDLVYVFAVTQLSHYLLDHLTLLGALQTLLLWFAVWMGWQYTAWVTNWFEPTALPIRLVLFGIMLVALVMASALPQAFGERALVFAGCYAAIQVGRTLWVLLALGKGDALVPNFRRILAWTAVSAALWIMGALADGNLRLGLWAAGVLCEYVAPMVGFSFPGLGRSATSDWTIDGGHLAERCQLFVIVALGESLLASGVAFGHAKEWAVGAVLTLLVTFLGSIAMWWMYFDTSSKDAAHVIEHSDDPGGIGAKFHYTHVVLVAGIIVSAVADELVIGHGEHHVEWKYLGALLGGPAIYLFGNALFKRVVYGFTPQSHIGGLLALALIAPFASHLSVATVGAMTTAVMVAVAVLESVWRRRSRARAAH
ncbi:low temperature requirement protein A [Variovorax robiniae]|uniref:Low temperature requirement protein A n=1 Tax=Variovorax robiniae TaxID=1836199 RepID=A0ABU8XE35_9BURK